MHLCRLPLSSGNKMKFNSYGTANSFGWTTTERYCLTAIFLSPQNPFLTHFGQTKAIQADPLDQLAATLGKQISACMAQISLFSTCLDIFNFHEWLATLYIFVNNKWASLFVDCGRQEAGGRRGVGWGKIWRRGAHNFRRFPERGWKLLDFSRRCGAAIFLINFFQCS